MNQQRVRWPGHRDWFHTTKLLFRCSLASWFLLAARAQSIDSVEVTGFEAHSLIQRFYFAQESQPCAILRTGWVHKDFERRGFFRIGILPMVALEKFQLEISNPELAANSFDQVQSSLRTAHGNGHLELRNVRFVIGNPTTRELTCERIRINPRGEWELLDGVDFRAGTNEFRASKGSLQVGGAQAGRLMLKDISLPQINFFSTNLNVQLLPKESSSS